MARIDRLQEEARRVLQMASVIGRIFPYRVLAAIAAEEGELAAHLLTLQREEMVRERARVPELEYIFKHHLTQEAAYNGLLRRERRSLHRQVAEAWERLSPDRVEERLGLLAHHWEQAGDRERAVEYLRRAGEQAAAQFANAEAVTYFTRALDLTSEEDLTARYDLFLARERVCDLQGVREAQTQDLAALEALAAALGDDERRAEVALRQAHYGMQTSDYPAAIAAAQEAIGLARGAGDTYLEARAHLQSGRVLQDLGDYEAAQHSLERALSLAREAGSLTLEARCLHTLGFVYSYQGDLERGALYVGQALRLSRELGAQDREGSALWLLGGRLIRQGEYDSAEMQLQQCLQIRRQLGDRHALAFTLGSLGWLRYRLGDYGGARPYHEQFLAIVRETQHARGVSIALSHLARVSLRLGDAEQGRQYAQEALRVGLGARDRFAQSWASEALGHALGDLVRLDEAAEAFQRALDLCRQLGAQSEVMVCLAGLACISLAKGNLAVAQEDVEEVLGYLATRSLHPYFGPFRVYLTCYRALRAGGDPRAEGILEDGHRLLQERAEKISDEEQRRSYLENVEEHREIVREYAERKCGGGGVEGDILERSVGGHAPPYDPAQGAAPP